MPALRRQAGGLIGALAVHGAILLWLARSTPGAALARDAALSLDVELERDDQPAPASTQDLESSHAPDETPPSGATPATQVARRPAHPSLAVEIQTGQPESTPPVAAAGQPFVFEPSSAPTLSNEALGLDGRNHFLGGIPGEPAPPSGPASAPEQKNQAPGIHESVEQALRERDHELGLDRGGPLIAVAEEITRPSETPVDGRVVLEVTFDGQGSVAAVRIADAGQARPAWERVASAMEATLRARHVVVRSGPRGMIVRLEVTSRWAMPSGRRADNPPVSGPHLEGDPSGGGTGVQFGFDVTDIGARPQRTVHARIMDERYL